MPTLREAVEYLRLNLLHDTGGTGVDWVTDDRTCRHTNEELTAYLNASVEEIIKRVHNYWVTVEATIEAPATAAPLSNEIALPVQRLERVDSYLAKVDDSGEIIGSPLCIDDLYVENSGWSLAKLDKRRLAWTILGDSVIVNGLEANTTYKFMQTWVSYPTKLRWNTDQSQQLSVDAAYSHTIHFYAAYLAFMKDDPDVLDLGRSEEMLSKFTREVGRNDNMYVKRRRNQRDRYKVTDYW